MNKRIGITCLVILVSACLLIGIIAASGAGIYLWDKNNPQQTITTAPTLALAVSTGRWGPGSRAGGCGCFGCYYGWGAGRNRRQNEHAIAPDDGRGRPAAGDRNLPFHVLGLAPFEGRVGLGRDAIREWTTPLMPILGGVRLRALRGEQGRQQTG